MALQIKGKFVENAAIDGDKIELKSGQSLKQKKADGTTAELIKLDESLTTGSKVRVNGEQVATQSQIDGISTQVSTQVQSILQAETAARVAADTALDARLDVIEGADTVEGSVAKAEKDAKDYADSVVLAEETRALAAEAALSAAITAEETARIADVNAEETRALAAESALSAAITAEETARIAGDASTLSAAKDYVELLLGVSDSASISALANLQTWLTDNDEATGVITALAAVEARVDTAESGISSLEGRMTTAEGDITAVESALAQELLDRQAGDADTLASANSYTDTQVGAEETRALAAEAAIQAEVNAVEVALAAETSAREAADTALDGRVDALEAVAHYKEKFVIPSTVPAFIELGRVAKGKSTVIAVGRLTIHEADEVVGQALIDYEEDYLVSVVDGKTRITFVGNLIDPGPEKLGAGDVIYVKYMA